MTHSIQLAEKAIKDRLTRILVLMGACAGMCYNALWYFPVLIVIGGAATMTWDLWLQRVFGRMRAKWELNRRRARDEGGDAETTNTTQSIPLREQAHVAPANLTQRKPQGESSERLASSQQEPAGSRVSAGEGTHESGEGAQAAAIADTKTHNISVKMGVSLIVGFLGMLQLLYPHH